MSGALSASPPSARSSLSSGTVKRALHLGHRADFPAWSSGQLREWPWGHENLMTMKRCGRPGIVCNGGNRCLT